MLTLSQLSSFCGVDATATQLDVINNALSLSHPSLRWNTLINKVLNPSLPFELHLHLHTLCFADQDSDIPWPAWKPSTHILQESNARQLAISMGIQHFSFAELCRVALLNRNAFWTILVKEHLKIPMQSAPSSMISEMDETQPHSTRFKYCDKATLNISEACLRPDYKDKTAVIYGPNSKALHRITYGALDAFACRVANAIVSRLDLQPGDSAAICMPMTLQAVVIVLALHKAAIAVVGIAESFSSDEIAVRLRVSSAKAVFTMDHVFRNDRKLALYTRVCAANAPTTVVISYRSLSNDHCDIDADLRDNDMPWPKFLENAEESFATVYVDSDTASNILFSSGTTSTPKAIVWTHTTPIKVVADAFILHDVKSHDVLVWPTSFGWMMGPWLMYASLCHGASMALYYDSPLSVGFCRFVETCGATMLGVVPSLIKAWRDNNTTHQCDWSRITRFSSTGEPSNYNDALWLMSRCPGYAPIIEYCGGTEIAGAYLCGAFVQPQVPAMFSSVAPGLDMVLLNDNAITSLNEDEGEVAIIGPSIGLSQRLLNADHESIYFDGMPISSDGICYRRHGDAVRRFKGGFMRAQGRVDDTMNLGGIKVSSVELENVCNSALQDVIESAAVAIAPRDGGPAQLVMFCVLKNESLCSTEFLLDAFKTAIKAHINPLFRPRRVCVLKKLPRTASGKIMRRALKAQHNASL